MSIQTVYPGIASATPISLRPAGLIDRSGLPVPANVGVVLPGHPSYALSRVFSRTSTRTKVLNLGLAAGVWGAARYVLGPRMSSLLGPKIASSFIVTTDPKAWLKIGAGLFAMNRVNKAFDFQPPPWLAALQTVAFINPLLMDKWDLKALKEMAITAPIVVGLVQGSHLAENALKPPLARHGVPEPVTEAAVRLTSLIAGFGAFRAVSSSLISASAAVCTRCAGCGNPFFCLLDIADMVGATFNTGRKASSGKTFNTKLTTGSDAHAGHLHASA